MFEHLATAPAWQIIWFSFVLVYGITGGLRNYSVWWWAVFTKRVYKQNTTGKILDVFWLTLFVGYVILWFVK